MPEPVAERTMVVAPGLAASVAREYAAWTVTRPLTLTVVLLALAMAAGGIAIGNPWIIGAAFLVPCAIAGIAVANYVAFKRSIAVAYPAGSTATAVVGELEFSSTTTMGSTTMSYAALRELWPLRSALVIRLRGSAVMLILPRELVTDADVETIRRGIAAATPEKP